MDAPLLASSYAAPFLQEVVSLARFLPLLCQPALGPACELPGGLDRARSSCGGTGKKDPEHTNHRGTHHSHGA